MVEPPYDPRAVANLLLDIADSEYGGRRPISNLALQKLLYFSHGHFLIKHSLPLVKGAFEAWTYGPVHPAVYQCFKAEGNQPIKTRAVRYDILTGVSESLEEPSDSRVHDQLREVINSYAHLRPGQLVDITHAPMGPWATIVNRAKTSVALGLRIPDSVTKDHFKYQKVSVGRVSRVGEPDEDTPFVRD